MTEERKEKLKENFEKDLHVKVVVRRHLKYIETLLSEEETEEQTIL